jgi:type IV pilus assembly protein PilW
MKNKTCQTGLTLIEIMIALLIGAFLLGGVLQIFITSKQTYRMQENLSRLQENGRFAMEFLSKDIRMAGYWDCMKPSSPNNKDIMGTEAPDTIILRGAFVRSHAPADDCGTAVIEAATIACPKAADPANFYTDTTSKITYSINSNTLRRATNCVDNANADIVEGIENMKILYGVETDAVGSANYGTPNYYVSANNIPDIDVDGIPDWERVVSIRITITARTMDGNLTATGDGRIRRDFTSTLAVRNRLP